MRKTFQMRNLECAHCAAKMENSIRRLPGVVDVNISFMTQKITIEAEDITFDSMLSEAQKICRKIEPKCEIVM